MNPKQFDVIVIGAGQAGLAMGYYLSQKRLSYLLIDSKDRIGEVWRSRYDSLVLFTPRSHSSLPGYRMEGDPDGFPTKDEVADYLERYAHKFSIPLQLQTKVTHLRKKGDAFELITTKGAYLANKVIIATGPFQKPFLPEGAENISSSVVQLHSSEYRNQNQLKEGAVLIVGGGNSGAQIAYECSLSREVTLSVSKPLKFLPVRLWNKSIFWWFDKLGLSKATTDSLLGRILRQNEPVIGKELRSRIAVGKVTLKPRAASFSQDEVLFEDDSKLSVNNIIWATGFRPDYSWIEIRGVVSTGGFPVHKRGVSEVPGLFFLGLPWQYRRGSALIGGVAQDAQYVSEQL
ncbi:NAD(P)/FAD-dependent oxidoreductase [Paenibacillus sp. 32352]|uniref:flavin-containing monooxygenase n=1 Tax=Paenibacillus sp. 32352 TaxID=1969111 RepID=UPI0009ADBE09|nr:NAD(P)-binding domain-containing protein [Paenibacillus sp. 32352]